jgi:hypothetical protein
LGIYSGALNMGFFDSIGDFFTGTPEKREQVSNLTPSQMKNQRMLETAAQERGAGGAFGTSADYYRDLLSNDSSDFNAFAAPEMRRFNEQIVPDLAEQFAGMGAGGLSSSGFRNAAVNAGSDLSERLGAIRASLRQQGAQGLQGIGQQSLNPYTQWQTTQPGSEGFLSSSIPAIGSAAGMAIGGPIGGAIGNMAGNWISGKGKSSPYGNQQINQNGFSSQLPDFNMRAR